MELRGTIGKYDIVSGFKRWVRHKLQRFLLNSPQYYGDQSNIIIPEGTKNQLGDAIFNAQSGTIEVGENIIFGHGVMIITGQHALTETGEERINQVIPSGNDIKISDGVYLGSGSIVIGPCDIGENAVIGAGSVVVTDEIEPNSLYAGNPAELKKIIQR